MSDVIRRMRIPNALPNGKVRAPASNPFRLLPAYKGSLRKSRSMAPPAVEGVPPLQPRGIKDNET